MVAAAFVSTAARNFRLTDNVAEHLAKAGVHHVRVSLDGATAETHDSIRGVAGSYRRAVSAVLSLKRAGVQTIGISPTMMQENFHEKDALIDFALQLGANEIRMGQVCNVGRGRAVSRLSAEQVSELRELISRKTRELGETLQVSGPEGTWEDKPYRKDVVRGNLVPDLMGCGGGRTLAAISPHGIVRCCLLFDFPIGDLRKTSFENIWKGTTENLKWLRSVKDGCRGCKNAKFCAGPCPLETANHPVDERRNYISRQCETGGKQCLAS